MSKKAPPKRQTREPTSIKSCPIAACRLLLAPGKLLCRDHWSLLPTTLQKTIHTELAKTRRQGKPTSEYWSAVRQALQIAGDQVRSPMKED